MEFRLEIFRRKSEVISSFSAFYACFANIFVAVLCGFADNSMLLLEVGSSFIIIYHLQYYEPYHRTLMESSEDVLRLSISCWMGFLVCIMGHTSDGYDNSGKD
ncbi:hypothetical protein DITRI_Ditri13aG0067100 [Diplodiscus trichospermus]